MFSEKDLAYLTDIFIQKKLGNISKADASKKSLEYLIQKGVKEFEEKIAGFNYRVDFPKIPIAGEGQSEFIKDREDWLKENCEPNSFIAFPNEAIGKYRDYWSSCYFKNKADAVIFKLTWI